MEIIQDFRQQCISLIYSSVQCFCVTKNNKQTLVVDFYYSDAGIEHNYNPCYLG